MSANVVRELSLRSPHMHFLPIRHRGGLLEFDEGFTQMLPDLGAFLSLVEIFALSLYPEGGFDAS